MQLSDALHNRVWQVLSQIPAGHVVTYGQLARMAGAPQHARAVGAILRQLPNGSGLPWHRVINSKGRLSFAEDSGAYRCQAERLKAEGIELCDGKIALGRYRWHGH